MSYAYDSLLVFWRDTFFSEPQSLKSQQLHINLEARPPWLQSNLRTGISLSSSATEPLLCLVEDLYNCYI